MENNILNIFYFLFPAYFANMMPVVFSFFKMPLGIPISEKRFGQNKTWRGFYSGYLGAFFILWIQKNLWPLNFHYLEINIFILSFCFGIGSLLGDLIKSFIKRRLNIKEGSCFFPWDQIDFILGCFFVSRLFFYIPFSFLFTAILITIPLHVLTNFISYKLGMKKVWY